MAHQVDLDDSFVNQMKMSIQATGGVLSLASTTYKHYLVNQTGANPTNATHNISTQVKSLKGLIVRPQNNALTGAYQYFPISTGQAKKALFIQSLSYSTGRLSAAIRRHTERGKLRVGPDLVRCSSLV